MKFKLDGQIGDVNEVLWEIMGDETGVETLPVVIELPDDDPETVADLKESCEENQVTCIEEE